jgi:hypothetical protein
VKIVHETIENKKRKELKKMKKLALFTLLTGFGLTMMTGCDQTKNNNQTLSFENMYNYSAVSGINLLSQTTSTTIAPKRQVLTQEEKDLILKNLQVVENMMSQGVVKSEEITSDRPEYETMYTLTASNLDGTKDVYTFYYNERLIEEEFDDGELEQEFRLEGLVVLDGMEYQMFGQKETENDEMEMSFKVLKDERNYVEIEQEMENDEQEFAYTLYENGRKTYETELEYEIDARKNKIEFEFSEKSDKDRKTYSYEYVTRKGKQYIYVKIKENGTTTAAVIEVVVDENNQVSYTFVE